MPPGFYHKVTQEQILKNYHDRKDSPKYQKDSLQTLFWWEASPSEKKKKLVQ